MAIDDKINLIQDKSEIGEVFENLDSEKISRDTNLASIDMNSRLSQIEIKNLAVFDQFKSIGLLPHWANIGMSIKRLNVSRLGLGRIEKVEIASAKRQAIQGSGISGAISRLFTPKV